MKYGSLNLLENSGPLQACIGIALSLFTKKFKVLQAHLKYQNIIKRDLQ